MKLIIIEDEIPALEKLERYILKYDPSSEVVACLSSIAETVEWFQNPQSEVDIIFMDIQLSDGLSFDIFHQVKIKVPIIFVTAFDEYAIDAFKVNGIDYILKPVTFTDVSNALNKFKQLKSSFVSKDYSAITDIVEKKKVKDRFLVRLGNHIHSIKVQDISLFYAEGRTAFLLTNQGKKYIVDYKLEDLEKLLDQQLFFRTNRTYIVNLNAIEEVVVYTNSRLKIIPKVKFDREIVIGRERVKSFKKWFEGN